MAKGAPKIFTPRSLSDRRPPRSFTSLAQNYFRVANELRDKSHHGSKWPGHYYVFPSVVMYMAAFEAFLQEMLTLAQASLEYSVESTAIDLIEIVDDLKVQRDFRSWTKDTFRIYGGSIDANSAEFQNLWALKELRNTVIHYNPQFIEYVHWPARLEAALHRTKLEVLNAGWVRNFSRPEIADWARETVKTAIELFCDSSGAENPFTTTASDGLIRWE